MIELRWVVYPGGHKVLQFRNYVIVNSEKSWDLKWAWSSWALVPEVAARRENDTDDRS